MSHKNLRRAFLLKLLFSSYFDGQVFGSKAQPEINSLPLAWLAENLFAPLTSASFFSNYDSKSDVFQLLI